ncbi:MAG: hypothetical protein NT027_19155 [Proteobacteria bacterium]|nr:hypothetical protein [Pseudomonadota bacterium]
MNHLENLKQMLQVLKNSQKINLLIVKGPPGWGKTHTVTSALNASETSYEVAGTFTTPLALFNQLAASPTKIHLLDDTAELFSNQQLLSILCSASWPTGADGKRIIKRSSTSLLSNQPDFEFLGKIIMITNKIPKSETVNALLSRSLQFSIDIDPCNVPAMLQAAAESGRFSDEQASREVVKYLAENLSRLDVKRINLRTLEIGYEIAVNQSQDWKGVFSQVLPWTNDSSQIEKELSPFVENAAGKSVADQIREYCKRTGKCRRSYFYQKKKSKEKPMVLSLKHM